MEDRDLTGDECMAVVRGALEGAPELRLIRTVCTHKPEVQAIKASRVTIKNVISIPARQAQVRFAGLVQAAEEGQWRLIGEQVGAWIVSNLRPNTRLGLRQVIWVERRMRLENGALLVGLGAAVEQ